jgi:hypothetical protein
MAKLATLQRWHEAVAAGEIEAALAVTAPDVAVAGPRGTAAGHEVLRAWLEGSGAAFTPRRWFCGAGDDVVVEQEATWPDGAGRTAPVVLATHFRCAARGIERIERHDALAGALAAAGLTTRDLARS